MGDTTSRPALTPHDVDVEAFKDSQVRISYSVIGEFAEFMGKLGLRESRVQRHKTIKRNALDSLEANCRSA
jgi:hypothetical protein